jgi:itaconate CoA-transferase
MGLSYEALTKDTRELIVCDISGYGDDGPYRDKKAYDLLIQSESGFLSITGTPDEPSKAGCSIADIAAGMYAYSNILAALLQRGKTGKGSPHRRLDARIHGRVDDLPAVLRVRRRRAAAAFGCRARHHLSLRPVPPAMARHGDAGTAERARMGHILRQVCCSLNWPPMRALTPTPSAPRHRDEAEGADRAGLRRPDAAQVVARLDEPPASPTPGSTTWPTCGAPAAEGARALGRGRQRRPATIPALLPPGLPSAVEPAWTRCAVPHTALWPAHGPHSCRPRGDHRPKIKTLAARRAPI